MGEGIREAGVKITLRRAGRWLLVGSTVLVLIAVLFVGLVLFPYPLFPHHESFKGFSVNSDRPIPEEFADVARDARNRVAAMELFSPEATYRIFLCRSEKLYAFFCDLTGKEPTSQALVFSVVGTMILSETGIEQMRRRTGGVPPHSRFEGSLSEAIAHEVAHVQVVTELGHRSAQTLPYWMTEGWVEYQANLAETRSDPDYSLPARVSLLLDDAAWGPPYTRIDRRHFRWQILVEYLCQVKDYDFEQLTENAVTEKRAWGELMAWYSEHPGNGL